MSGALDLIASVRFYVDKIVSDASVGGTCIFVLAAICRLTKLLRRDEGAFNGSCDHENCKYGVLTNANS